MRRKLLNKQTNGGLFKPAALFVSLIALVFFAFFNASKQIPVLAAANPFAEDPYDAVGSFGIQLAMATALLSALRALRSGRERQGPDVRIPLIIRAGTVSLLSVFVTLAADGIALARYPHVWMPFQAGRLLATMVGTMFLLTALGGWGLARAARGTRFQSRNRRSITVTVLILLLSAIILADCPESWRMNTLGAIFTALVGMLLLMIPVAALSWLWAAQIQGQFDDLFDDISWIWKNVAATLSTRVRWLAALFGWLDRIFMSRPVLAMANWLDPRRHPARFGWSISALLGIGFLIGYSVDEGLPPSLPRSLFVGSVLFSIELAGALVSYVLFAKFLGIYRDERTVR
jgi:hypothetical protein